jgi:hypothetical protein
MKKRNRIFFLNGENPAPECCSFSVFPNP